jgi:hypothetical protein
MNKKIIGYKLIKPEYVNAVISITGIYGYDNPVEFINNYFNSPFTIEGNFIKSLKQAGVLDLWFEPIYEKEVIPEYVECIELPKSWTTYTKIGKIYKTDAYPSGGYRIIYEDGGGQMTQGKEYCFKPSTKEAYVAQNQTKTEQIFTKEQEDYIKNLINNEIKKLQ